MLLMRENVDIRHRVCTTISNAIVFWEGFVLKKYLVILSKPFRRVQYFFLFVFLLIMVIMIVHFKVLLIVMRVIPGEVLFKKKKSYILQEVY